MLEAVGIGLTLGLWLAISVGPIMFTVIKQSLDNGRAGGIAFISGIALSDIILVICANVFTGFFASLAAYEKQIELIGCVFLLGLGIFFCFFKKPSVQESTHQLTMFKRSDYAKMFGAGMVMNFLNPGIIVVWLTAATASHDRPTKEKFVIFGIALLLAYCADVSKVMLASYLRKKLTPSFIHRIDQITGVILILFAIVLGWLAFNGKHGIHS